jgi:hypothetical protein
MGGEHPCYHAMYLNFAVQPLSISDIEEACDELFPPAFCVESQTCDIGVHTLNCPDFFAHHPFHKSLPPN